MSAAAVVSQRQLSRSHEVYMGATRPPEIWARHAYRNPTYFHECDRGFMNPTPDRTPGPKDDASTRESWRHIDLFFREKLRP